MTTYRKKLIEVALPLEAINIASAREKSIRHGHPSTLHLWWARRPLAACRAVIFASLIDDPEQEGVPEELLRKIDELDSPIGERGNEAIADFQRRKLFYFIEKLVQWESTNDEKILNTARELILAATKGAPPPLLDPFCGGGSIPLEGQRLGLTAYGKDLNPVAVLITKAMIELPPKFANQPPVNPEARKQRLLHKNTWKGPAGLAEDVRYYGQWMRDEAFKRIGHLYPKVKLPKEYGGGEATIIAWLWARTVKCPNPACGVQMPLVSSFELSTKKGKEAWIEPIINYVTKKVHFEVTIGKGKPPSPPKTGRGANFRCLVCSQNVEEKYIKAEASQGRMSAQSLAIVCEGKAGRIYLNPDMQPHQEYVNIDTDWLTQEMPKNPRWFSPPLYGLSTYGAIFTPRQLVTLTNFSDLVGKAREKVLEDSGGNTPYADAITTYLAMAIDRTADRNSTICSWDSTRDSTRNTFARQAIPMTWDYAEANPFSESTGNFLGAIEWIKKTIELLPANVRGFAHTTDAVLTLNGLKDPLISTDPPYYDNIGYADLSDFFYVWLRRSLREFYPDLFDTLLTPKDQELVATPYRFGGSKEKAQKFFEDGLEKVFVNMHKKHPDYPITIFYAFKQVENSADVGQNNNIILTSSTGWETMLEALFKANLSLTGTWPMRTELANRMVGLGTNSLASSIVLVCRPRPMDAPLATRREFLNALKAELPTALRNLQSGNIAPVDLAQASIGPGMAVFSRYSKVIESDGTPMRVRTALQIINQVLDEVLAEQEGEYDADTRWAIAWFDQFGQNEGLYGTAETLSKAKNTSIEGLVAAGFLLAKAGKVRLLKREELDSAWSPANDQRLTIWEITQHLIEALDKRGEQGAAELLVKIGGEGEIARDLAYRLYTTCERKGWAQEALAYNTLVVSWPEITRLTQKIKAGILVQGKLGI